MFISVKNVRLNAGVRMIKSTQNVINAIERIAHTIKQNLNVEYVVVQRCVKMNGVNQWLIKNTTVIVYAVLYTCFQNYQM
jgi:hypothetical protein